MPPNSAMHSALRPAFFAERYAVYEEFAAGGMATVHLARLNGAQGFRRTVAVKRLLPHLTRNQDFAHMLLDEARLASRVRHHNVVSTLDVVQTADELLLVMEYIHGESLAKLVRWSAEQHEAIPVPIALAIVIDALRGLDAAHEAKDEQGRALGLVHRDVSPQNVLIGLDGITRIADFGVAKAAGRAHSTRDGVVKGKLAYMAPEQLGSGEVSRASDVFAAAAVLWELLAGARLFAGKNHAETVFKVMSAPLLAPSTRRAELSPELDAIVLRGLERDPARRYASAGELARALESASPSLRPSQLASWVERVVGDRLALRSQTLRAIEQSEAFEARANVAVAERVRADTSHALSSTLKPAAVERESQQSERAAQREPRATDSERSAQAAARSAAPRALMGGVLVALLASLSTAWWMAAPRDLPASAPADSDARKASEGANAQRVRETAVQTPTTLESVHSALGSGLQEPFVADDASVSPRGQRAAAGVRAGRANRERRLPSARKRGNHGCDPPYSIDPAGRVLFKVECM